jgi:hypothetical protein
MAMNMARAFNARMMTTLIRYELTAPGTYDAVNDFIEGTYTPSNFKGVITTGNKFSQFEEGVALKPTESGERFSDYRTLYVPLVSLLTPDDRVGYLGQNYNIVQMSPEDTFNFRGYLLEKDKNWVYVP